MKLETNEINLLLKNIIDRAKSNNKKIILSDLELQAIIKCELLTCNNSERERFD